MFREAKIANTYPLYRYISTKIIDRIKNVNYHNGECRLIRENRDESCEYNTGFE